MPIFSGFIKLTELLELNTSGSWVLSDLIVPHDISSRQLFSATKRHKKRKTNVL